MAKHSWPNGVTSWDDTVKFAQLVFGQNVSVENYSHRLPHASKKSFLLFAKGACGPDTPFHGIGQLIEPHMAEVKKYELSVRNKNQRPQKSQQMLGSDNQTVHYWSTQLTRAPCTCRSGFGADSHQKHVPTSSDMWSTGESFVECHIAEELWVVCWPKSAAHLAGQDVAGSVELEWPQSRSWHSAAWRWVLDVQLFRSHHIFLFWAWRGVDVVWQKSSTAEQDVVSGRWGRFGDGRRVSIWLFGMVCQNGPAGSDYGHELCTRKCKTGNSVAWMLKCKGTKTRWMVSRMCGWIAPWGGTQHTGKTVRASAIGIKCFLMWLFASRTRQRRRALLKFQRLLWLATLLGLLVSSGHKTKLRCVMRSAQSRLPAHLTQCLRTRCGSCWSLCRMLRTARCIVRWCLGWRWWEGRRCMTNDQHLRMVESSTLQWRKTLLEASETVAEYGEKFAAKVDSAPLNGIGGATTSHHSQASRWTSDTWPIMANIPSVWCHIETWTWRLTLWASQRWRNTWRLQSTWTCWRRECFLQSCCPSRAGTRGRKKKPWDMNG